MKHIVYFDRWGEVKLIGHVSDLLCDLEWSISFQ
jgi:hypothetical protein